MMQAATKRSPIKRAACAAALAAIVIPLAAGPAAATTSTGKAQKLASAAMLTTADMPGWTLVKSTSVPLNTTGSVGSSQSFPCSGVTLVKRLAGSESEFTDGAQLVLTSAVVDSSTSAAKTDIKSLKTAHGLSCLQNGLLADLQAKGVTSVSVSRTSAKVSGADDLVAIKVTIQGTSNGAARTVDQDYLTERVGQTVILVLTENVNSGFPSLKKAESYAHTLAKRVRGA